MDSYMEQGWKEDKHSSCTLTEYYFFDIISLSSDLCHKLAEVFTSFALVIIKTKERWL
jgi:hypothetical protein